jgi:hypothetical protein
MRLDLFQLIGGTATFCEPGRPAGTATEGYVVSMPLVEWLELGSPSAIEIPQLRTTQHSGTEPKPQTDALGALRDRGLTVGSDGAYL